MSRIGQIPARVGRTWSADGTLQDYLGWRRERAHRQAARAQVLYTDRTYRREDWDAGLFPAEWVSTSVGTGSSALLSGNGGLVRLTTTLFDGSVRLDYNNFRITDITLAPTMEIYSKLGQTAACRSMFGFAETALIGTTNNTIYLEYDSTASANWRGVCDNAGTKTTLDLGVAADANWRVMRIETFNSPARLVNFYISNANTLDPLYVGTITTNIPTVAMQPNMTFYASADGAKNWDIDYTDYAMNRRTS